jgi:hypothetical protein
MLIFVKMSTSVFLLYKHVDSSSHFSSPGSIPSVSISYAFPIPRAYQLNTVPVEATDQPLAPFAFQLNIVHSCVYTPLQPSAAQRTLCIVLNDTSMQPS